VKLVHKSPRLTSASKYTTFVRRPLGGRCKVITRFLGDFDHRPSRDVEHFRKGSARDITVPAAQGVRQRSANKGRHYSTEAVEVQDVSSCIFGQE
jgi:hypothetical protein